MGAMLDSFGAELVSLGWVSDLLVAGSLASSDYVTGVSDLELVAVVRGPVDADRVELLARVHRRIDAGAGSGLKLGCVYVDQATLPDPGAHHPTWTHGRLVRRILSGVTRAELVRHGYAVLSGAGRSVARGHHRRSASGGPG
jgi:hypothetical protein